MSSLARRRRQLNVRESNIKSYLTSKGSKEGGQSPGGKGKVLTVRKGDEENLEFVLEVTDKSNRSLDPLNDKENVSPNIGSAGSQGLSLRPDSKNRNNSKNSSPVTPVKSSDDRIKSNQSGNTLKDKISADNPTSSSDDVIAFLTQEVFIKKVRVLHACIITAASFLVTLYIDSYSSPIEDTLLNNGLMTIGIYPVFASTTYLGAFTGSLIAGPLGEWLGIKSVLIFFSVFGMSGGMLLVLAHDSSSMIIGRALLGLYCGMGLSLSPIYNAEITPLHLRKYYGSFFNIGIGLGLSFSYLLGIWIGYRYLALLYMFMTAFMVANILILPESPRWLRLKGRLDKSQQAIDYFHSSKDCVSLDISQSVRTGDFNLRKEVASYLVWPVIRPLLICCTVQIFKVSSGYIFLSAFYVHTIESGVSMNPKVLALFSALSLLLGSIVFLFIIDKVRWKLLLMVTTFIQVVCNLLLGICFHLSVTVIKCSHTGPHSALCTTLLYAPLPLNAIFEFSMALGWGSLCWWLYGEILSPHYNRISAGIITFVCYSAAYFNQLIPPMLVEKHGSAFVFFEPGENYFRILAEERRKALKETLAKNEELFLENSELKDKNSSLQGQLDSALELVQLYQQLLDDKDSSIESAT
ncbi:hypothetical protein LOD99_13893 [Oopsacas minuta]|uniref:Major facilitator superfamily (MFS) profile domain-containing protein n=1 Tax=Oopsacas minuta TaxID=111878 RepID=A0AAV7KHE6_9METZ|nr:hypothetical protein LOD99_13893 [Oopsacas minuta]